MDELLSSDEVSTETVGVAGVADGSAVPVGVVHRARTDGCTGSGRRTPCRQGARHGIAGDVGDNGSSTDDDAADVGDRGNRT